MYTKNKYKFMTEKHLIKKTKEKLQQKKCSKNTITTYLFYLQKYLDFLQTKKIKDDLKSVKKFLDQQTKEKKSTQTYNLILNILKFFYANVQANVDKLEIKNKRQKNKQITTLTNKQINQILENTKNEKHYLIFALSYGSGLRLNELITLRIKDLDFDKDIIKICNKQGRELRKTILPTILKNKLHKYQNNKKPLEPLFTNNKNTRLSERTIQQALKRALVRAKIKKNVSFQALRNSFAIHLLESGIGIKSLQETVGHKNIRSTKNYQKNVRDSVTKIKSPL
jgi:site-specific recombinase XerD